MGIIRRTKEVVKTDTGKNTVKTKYNKVTKKGVTKEKDITYKDKSSPRMKYVDKEVVKRTIDSNWKSSKSTKKLYSGGKKVKSSIDFKIYD